MSDTLLQSGTEIATDLRTSSDQSSLVGSPVKNTGDLLAILQEDPPRSFSMLKTTCSLLGVYLNQPGNQILFDTIDVRRGAFRRFLASRKYAENSIRSYVYQVSVLMKTARRFGWRPDAAVSEEWKALLILATEKKLEDVAGHLSRITKTPAEVTTEELDRWGDSRIQDGILFTTVTRKKNQFWRLLLGTGWTKLNPPHLMKQNKYGIPLDRLAPELKSEVQTLLKWKQAEFAINRPKRGKIRAVSAESLSQTICRLAGFVINICGVQPRSFTDLIQKHLLEGFVEWAINERGVKGHSIQPRLAMIAAVVNHHPAYASMDFSWFKRLIDSIPIEDDSERKKRKAAKYVEYEVLETIPRHICAVMESARAQKAIKNVERMSTEALMMRWLLVLPWRERNLIECRIGGPVPNLFKSKIPPFSDLDRSSWVTEEEARNPDAEFWQFQFSSKETKTGIAVHALLPRQLIGPLEEYLVDHRPGLLGARATANLFLNSNGTAMRAYGVYKLVGKWSLQCGGVRTTPHLFRDSVAYKWLKENPKDYLTLSKLLWHKNVQTTIRIYGSRFNESSGVVAMESWLDEREAKSK